MNGSETIGVELGHVARLMRRYFDARARSIGVTRPQWQVLTLLARNEGIHQGGLAEILEVEPITLGRMVDRLQEACLVERRADPLDRRTWRLFLTPKGKQLMDQLRPLSDETVALTLEGLGSEERAALMRMLDRMRANLSRKPDEG